MADFFQNLWFEFIPLLVYGRGGRGITVKVKEIVQFISGAGSPLGDQEGDKSLRGSFLRLVKSLSGSARKGVIWDTT